MMTYTSAHDFYVRRRLERHRHLRLDLHLHLPRSPQARHRVLMNCVDTGWVTDNAPGGAGPVAKTHATCYLARSRAISPHISVFVARTHATRAEAGPATPRRPRARFPTRLGCRPTHSLTRTVPRWVAAPLDEEDGAARVLDPFFMHLADPAWLVRGQFFRNYYVAGW